MRFDTLAVLSIAIALGACASTSEPAGSGPTVVRADAAQRTPLLEAVSKLQGRWTTPGPEGESTIEFQVTSAGHAVREIMFPGTPHEMTNMYTLDGNSLVMTHYCAGGNQPHMRASALDGNRLAFRADGVSDLKAPDEVYMGEMTLVFVDDGHVEQRWRALKAGQPESEMVFELTRAR